VIGLRVPPPNARSRRAPRLPLLVLGAALLPAGLSAAELVQRDLLLTVGEQPTSFTYTLSDPTSSRQGSDSFSQNVGVEVGGRYSFAGAGDASSLVLGGALVANQASYGSSGHYTGYGLRVDGGYGWAISDAWSVGGRLELGLGLATFDLQAGDAFPALSTGGSTISYGVAVDVDYALSDTFTALLDVGYLRTDAKLSGGGVDLTVDTTGFSVAIGIAYRFSVAPRPVD
jgi:hypothetical protein